MDLSSSEAYKPIVIRLTVIAALLWWYGYKIVQRLDIIIRRMGGTPPGDV